MTDAEQVQFLVDRLWGGKWPSVAPFEIGHNWNPLVYIEDAFMVLEAIGKPWQLQGTYLEGPKYLAVISGRSVREETVMRAIVSAAVAALEDHAGR